MVTSDLMLCAQSVIRDAETSALSVVNILEDMVPEGLPLLVPRFMVYARLHRDIQKDPQTVECKIRVSITDKTLIEHTINIDFQDKAANRLVVDISGLVIPTVGELETTLWQDSRLLNKYVVNVREPRKPKVAVQSVEETTKPA